MIARGDLTELERQLLDDLLYEEMTAGTPEAAAEEAEVEVMTAGVLIPADDPGFHNIARATDSLHQRGLTTIGPEGLWVLTDAGRALAQMDPRARLQ
jgi:hypothetical protein